ncbi:hypothetical protein [Marinobacter salarius]|uniref:Uncharacterized protein n=1 Tax=Marinobacter salarius TaxID=1420917 RepID=A0A1W6K957_9GAMM|nr:hypothetical protein [Marinobacter salarius]ARM83953.1 hypothetical protein MARSALSMR5_01875 [Marinobacter salarius]
MKSLNEICRQYLKGRKLRLQAKELSNASLARKFECSERTIAKVASGTQTGLPDDDCRIIRACIAERNRLKAITVELSMPKLARENGLSHHSIVKHLEFLGEREVAV